MRPWRSIRGGVAATVDEQVLRGDVAGMRGAEEGRVGTELPRIAEAARRYRRLARLPQRFEAGPSAETRLATCRRWASVANRPGSRLLMVTLCCTVCRARPEVKPTSPERAPFDSPSSCCGIFTLRDTMFRMRPKRRAIMPSTVRRIISIGPSIIASIAAIQSSRLQCRKSPGNGPSALFNRISGAGQASSAAARPSGRVRSPITAVTRTAGQAVRIAVAASVSGPSVRATRVTSTPSRASCIAHARPMPRLAPNRSALRPAIPRSIVGLRR